MSKLSEALLRWGPKKEGELATRNLEFEYLHRKSRCEMLIGGDDCSNDIVTLGTCFSMFVYICARFRFSLIGGNLTGQSTGSRRGIGGGIQIPETQLQARGLRNPQREIQNSRLWGTCCDYLLFRAASPWVPETFHAWLRVSVFMVTCVKQ